MKRFLLILAAAAMLVCLFAISVSAEADPNAEYYDKVYTDLNGREFPIYEKDGDTYHPLVWFAYDITETNEETGETTVIETKYVKVRWEDIGIYSLEPSQGRFNGCFYTHIDEDGNTIELNTSNLVVLNLRAGVMAATYSSSKKQNGTNRTILTIETNRTDSFPDWSRIEAVYIPLTQKTVGSLWFGSLRVCDIDKNHPISIKFANKAFQNSKIEELFIPGGSSFGGNSNFQGCKMLKKVVFGEGFTASFPNYLFDGCSSLEMVCFMGTESEMDNIVIGTVNNGYYNQLTKISAQEYEALEDKSGKYKIYDCSACIAFNGGAHTISEDKEVVGNDFFGTMSVVCPCSVEGCTASMVVGTIEALVSSKGYSAKMFGDDLGLVCEYTLNKNAINEYKKYIPDFDIGILAAVNRVGDGFAPMPNETGVVDIVFDSTANDYISVKLLGIPEGERDTLVVFCAYVIADGKIFYLENGATETSAYGVCYNDFVE